MMKLLERYNIQGKLFLIFGVIALIASVMVGINVYTATILDQRNEDNLAVDNLWQEAALAIVWVQEMEKAQAQHLSSGDPNEWYRYVYASQQYEEILDNMLLETTRQNEYTLLQDIKNTQKAYYANLNDVLNEAQGNEAALYGNTEAIAELTDRLDKEFIAPMYDSFGVFFDYKNNESGQALDRAEAYYQATTILSAALVVLFLIAALSAAMLIVTQISRPVAYFTRAIAAAEADQFKPEMLLNFPEKGDEVGLLMRSFIDMQQAVRQREEEMQRRIEEMRARIQGLEQTHHKG